MDDGVNTSKKMNIVHASTIHNHAAERVYNLPFKAPDKSPDETLGISTASNLGYFSKTFLRRATFLPLADLFRVIV
jgi:hypothetical protein